MNLKQILGLLSGSGTGNAMITLFPYKLKGVWMFDDERKGLEQEAFVMGIDDMLDKLTAESGIENPERGFRLTISATPFPTHSVELERLHADGGGRWYFCHKYDICGWLCPALFKYFRKAPKKIFAKAEKL